MKRVVQSFLEKVKVFLINYTKNESYTLLSDIKELFATYVLSIGYYILYILPQRNNLKKTKRLKNMKKGKKCFVFANGPSMSLLDLKKIEKYKKSGFDVICVNNYINSEMGRKIVPNYYVLSDPVSFNVHTQGVSNDFINAQKSIIDLLNELNIPVFIPAQFNFNTLKNYYVFNDMENRFTNNIDPTRPRGYPSMTAYKALAIACYFGYDTIYICGFDNDYFKTISVDEDNSIYVTEKHYYDDGGKVKIPNYIRNLSNLLWRYFQLFKYLELFRHHNIINLDENGLVDVFSKHHELDIYKGE